MGTIRYIDHETTGGLKAKYANDPNVDINQIVDVDYVWGTQTLSELVADEAPFDYVIASHVIEHVPDFVGWLQEVHSVLRPGGILSLAIPHKQFCFDYYRALSRPADVIEAYLENRRKPSLRQIFDHYASAVSWRDVCAWGEVVNEQELRPMHSHHQTWAITQQVMQTGAYRDVHCWVFTPQSFFQILQILISLDLCNFQVAQVYPRQGCEFYVSLQAIEPGKPGVRAEQLASLPPMELHATEPEAIVSADGLADPQAEIHALKAEKRHLQEKLERQRERLRQQRITNQELRSRLQTRKMALHTCREQVKTIESSKLWRLQKTWASLKKRIPFTR
jgi:predicted SAM-dependent methyltransferase